MLYEAGDGLCMFFTAQYIKILHYHFFFFYDHSTLVSGLKLISLFFNKNYLQVWLCGGSMEVLPCSRVAHIARIKKPYHSNIAFHTRRNALRVAEVWMDEYKSNVYLAWNIPMEVREFFFF